MTPACETPTTANLRPKVLLGVSGSVAAIKAPEIAVRLVEETNADVRILLTEGGKNFWAKSEAYDKAFWEKMTELSVGISGEKGRISTYSGASEWHGWNHIGDPVLHIILRDWADVLLICPLSAHTLSKIANGLCDDTLSCVARAWDFGHGSRPGKPLLLVPAMNTAMWEHPLTRSHLNTIKNFWNLSRSSANLVRIVQPQVKSLACGEVGVGALAAVDNILSSVVKSLNEFNDKGCCRNNE